MTDEQAKQYEICKTRKHEAYGERETFRQTRPISQQDQYQMQANTMAGQQYSQSQWKICRWCGTQYQEVQETRQVEKA